MQRRAKYLELSCRQCHWRETCGPEDIAGWLRKTGKLRAGRVPELAVLYELLEASAPALVCPKCGQTGLGVAVALDDEDWPDLVSCEACGKPIPKERLEAIPGTPLCAACQHLSDLGHPKLTARTSARGAAPPWKCGSQPSEEPPAMSWRAATTRRATSAECYPQSVSPNRAIASQSLAISPSTKSRALTASDISRCSTIRSISRSRCVKRRR